MNWSYGLLAVASRRHDLLPATLASLAKGGFDRPWIFADGITHEEATVWERELSLPVVSRHPPRLRVAGNWMLALWELYVRKPDADRFALFQDDITCVQNLRRYLDACAYPQKGYLNCYCFPHNEAVVPRENGRLHTGWHASNQRGLGAVALIFDREALVTLLSAEHMARRPLDLERGWKTIDGGIVESMRKAGYKEFIHYPSLVMHHGLKSTMQKTRTETGYEESGETYQWKPDRQARSYPGDAFDALALLGTGRKGTLMSERLQQILRFFRPLPECEVTSNDLDEVSVRWQGAPGTCRYRDSEEGVVMDFLADPLQESSDAPR